MNRLTQWWRRVAGATAVGLAVGGITMVVASGPDLGAGASAPAASGPGAVTVMVEVRHSHFFPDRIRVRPGTTVEFVVVNHDPIGHELIVGPPEVHARHELGTEAAHGAVPGEVSVGPDGVATTTYRFPARGSVLYACHLPGHFAYGMRGHVVVG